MPQYYPFDGTPLTQWNIQNNLTSPLFFPWLQNNPSSPLFIGPPAPEIDPNKEAEEKEQELMLAASTELEKKMIPFQNTVNALYNKFNLKRPVYTMYLKFILNDNIIVDTTSLNWIENVLVDFSYDQTCVGEANKFTLTILFKPNERNWVKITELEAKLLTLKSIESLEEVDDWFNCKFEYGYGDELGVNKSTLVSKPYYGLVTKYTSKIENGNLKYTITGVSGLYAMKKEDRISITDEELINPTTGEVFQNPLLFIKHIVETKTTYKVEFLLSASDIDKLGTIENTELPICNDKNIFQFITDTLKLTCTTEDLAAFGANIGSSIDENGNTYTLKLPTQLATFGYAVDDTTNSINIYMSDPTTTDYETKSHLNLDFSWFGPGVGKYNFLVKDWVPEFDGTILMALASKLQKPPKEGPILSYSIIDDDGTVKEIDSLGSQRIGGKDNPAQPNAGVTASIQEFKYWAFATQYPYKATMTLIGCPCEVPITGRIKIKPTIYTEPHHSAGVYMILKKKDNISNSGYFTTLELFKCVKCAGKEIIRDKAGNEYNSMEEYDNTMAANTAEAEEYERSRQVISGIQDSSPVITSESIKNKLTILTSLQKNTWYNYLSVEERDYVYDLQSQERFDLLFNSGIDPGNVPPKTVVNPQQSNPTPQPGPAPSPTPSPTPR